MESSLPLNVKSVSHEIKTGKHMGGKDRKTQHYHLHSVHRETQEEPCFNEAKKFEMIITDSLCCCSLQDTDKLQVNMYIMYLPI